MDRWLPILIIVFLLGIGFVGLLRELLLRSADLEFGRAYLGKFIDYVNTRGEDHEAYDWMIERSVKMQRTVGTTGIMAYRASFGRFTTNNYAIILNAIPEIRKEITDTWAGDRRAVAEHAQIVDDCLRRYIGQAKDHLNRARRNLRNPVKLLCEGVRTVLGVPVYVLAESGLIGSERLGKIVHGKLFSLLSGLVSLLGLLASIMSIILGWGKLMKVLGL